MYNILKYEYFLNVDTKVQLNFIYLKINYDLLSDGCICQKLGHVNTNV